MKTLMMTLTVIAVLCLPMAAGADCPDRVGTCWAVPNCPNATCGPKVEGPMSYGTCWSWTGCKPCHSQDTYRRQCKEKYCPGDCKILGCNCDNWYFSFRDDSGNEIDN